MKKACGPSWFPLCVRTYLAEYIVGMTPEQAGAYTFLVLAAWLQTPPASLPNEDTALARLAGYRDDVLAWGKVRSAVLSGWASRDDGRLSLFWLRQLYDDATCKSRQARAAASAQRPHSERIASAERPLDTRASKSLSQSSSLPVSDSGGMQGGPTSIPTRSVRFWSALDATPILALYPSARQVKRPKAIRAILEALNTLDARGEPDPKAWLSDRVRAFSASPASTGEFVPHADTWFTDARYDDPPEAWQAPAKQPSARKSGVNMAEVQL